VQTDFVNRHDVWMAQASRGNRFGAQTQSDVRSAKSSNGQQLHRNEPVQADLAGAIDNAHAAAADFFEQFVIAQPGEWRPGIRRGWHFVGFR